MFSFLFLESDCTSEREFACPPKRRCQHDYEIFDDRLQNQIRKIDGPEFFAKRNDLRIQKFDEFCPMMSGDLFSDSDSLSFASLSRSSSLIQFESLEKQMQNDTTSFGSSPSLYSQLSMEMENQQAIATRLNNESKVLKIFHPSATATGTSESSSDTDSSLSSGASNAHIKIRLNDEPLDREIVIVENSNCISSGSSNSNYLPKNEIKEKNSIESLSEDSGYSENISFLRTKSYSIPCLRRKKFQNENNHNTISESSKSLEDVCSSSTSSSSASTNRSNHLYLDSRSPSPPTSSTIIRRNKNGNFAAHKIKSDDALLSTNIKTFGNKNTNNNDLMTTNSTNCNSSCIPTNLNGDTKNKFDISRRQFHSTRSPILHEEIGLIFNGTSGSNSSGINVTGQKYNNRVESPDFCGASTNRTKSNFMNSLKDLYVVSSVPENLNICSDNFDCGSHNKNLHNNISDEQNHRELNETERLSGDEQFDSFDDWSTTVIGKSVNFYNFEHFNPTLTMSYANLTLLNDDMGSDGSRGSFRNSFERPKPKELSILDDFSRHFDKDLSILNDKSVDYDLDPDILDRRLRIEDDSDDDEIDDADVESIKEKPKIPPPPPPRRTKLNPPEVEIVEIRTKPTFDRDPTNLVTCYAESLERCTFDLNPPSNPPSRLNSNDCLNIKSQPLSTFNSFVASTPNLNFYSSEPLPQTDYYYKSMRQISSTSKGNLSKGVSFCPIVSEISWKETSQDHQSSFEDSLNGDEEYYEDDEDDDDDDEDNNNHRNIYKHYDPIQDDDDYSDLNPPTTQIFSKTTTTNSTSLPNIKTTLATTQNSPVIEFTNSKYENDDRLSQHMKQNEVNNTNTLNKESSPVKIRSSTHNESSSLTITQLQSQPQNTIQSNEKVEKKNNFSCKSTIMDSAVQSKQLASQENLKEQNPQHIKKQQQLINVNSNKVLIKKMEPNLMDNNKKMESGSVGGGVGGKKSKGFFSRLSNFRFSLKSKDKKNKKIKNINEINNSANPSDNGKSVTVMKNDLGNNNLKINHQIKSDTKDYVFIPLREQSNIATSSPVNNKNHFTPQSTNNDDNFIEETNQNLYNNHFNNNNNNSIRKESSIDEVDGGEIYDGGEISTNPNGDGECNNTNNYNHNGVNNHTNSHMLLTSKPPLPKQPPRVIGVSAKRTNSAHAPSPSRRSTSIPRENSQYDGECYTTQEIDDDYYLEKCLNNISVPSLQRQSLDSSNRFLMSEKQYYGAKNLNNNNLNKTMPNQNGKLLATTAISSSRYSNHQSHDNYNGSKIGLIETNLDTHETIVTGKTRSLMELLPNHQYYVNTGDDDGSANSRFNQTDVMQNINGGGGSVQSQSRRPHKSMEFLLDKENQKNILVSLFYFYYYV